SLTAPASAAAVACRTRSSCRRRSPLPPLPPAAVVDRLGLPSFLLLRAFDSILLTSVSSILLTSVNNILLSVNSILLTVYC
ncbi:unnamed protein product, partial [Musa textilis]